MKSPMEEANEAMKRATKVLEFLKEHCPEDYQRALDYVDGLAPVKPKATFEFKDPDPDCKRCEGKGWYMVANGPDDFDKEPCECITNE